MALPGTQGTSSSCHGNAAASECQQHHREGDLQCSCQGTAVPGEQPGAGRSPRAVSQQAIHPFPSPPTAPAALTSMSCSVKATLQKEMYCQRWRHHHHCMWKMPLVCSHECQGCQASSEVGTQVPPPPLESSSCGTEKQASPIPGPCGALGIPCPAAPEGHKHLLVSPVQAQPLQHRQLTGKTQQWLLRTFCTCREAITPWEKQYMTAFA